jgi:short-subunit dehydrogenase
MAAQKDLKEKTALITGASSGLGLEFARQLAQKGCRLILTARRKERLESSAQELRQDYGVAVAVYRTDLSQKDAAQKLYNQIQQDGLQVDILINNAGFGIFGLFAETSWTETERLLDVDIKVLTQLTRIVLPDMVERGNGHILLVSSIAGYQPTPTYAAYGAAKAYVLHFGEALRYELQKKKNDIHVTVLSPGVTETEFLQVAGQKKTLYQKLVIMQAREVVRSGLKALKRNKPSVIPGLINAFLTWSIRFAPRRWVPAVAYRFMKND